MIKLKAIIALTLVNNVIIFLFLKQYRLLQVRIYARTFKVSNVAA